MISEDQIVSRDQFNQKPGFKYTTPDGAHIDISGYEQYQLAESLFTLQKDGDDVSMNDIQKTIPSLITESINSVDHDI